MAKKAYYETKAFKKLQAAWYEKAGVEVEKHETVIQPEIINTKSAQYNSGDNYFRLCQAILTSFRFRRDVHRTIFSLHTEGRSEREIVAFLADNLAVKFTQRGVGTLLTRIKESYLKGENQ